MSLRHLTSLDVACDSTLLSLESRRRRSRHAQTLDQLYVYLRSPFCPVSPGFGTLRSERDTSYSTSILHTVYHGTVLDGVYQSGHVSNHSLLITKGSLKETARPFYFRYYN